MSEVPLYPWVIERTIFFLKAFDESWFEKTDAGLVPKDEAAKLKCLATSYSWGMRCKLPHALDSAQLNFMFEDGLLYKSTRAYPQNLFDGDWVGRAWFEEVEFVQNKESEAEIVEDDKARWESLLNNGRDEELPKEEISPDIDDNCLVDIELNEYPIQQLIVHSLWKSGNPIPAKWEGNQDWGFSFSAREVDAYPILDVYEAAFRLDKS